MPWYETLKEERNHDYLRKRAESQILWIHRPLLIHERAPDKSKVCPCCNSRLAAIVEERSHLDVLVDPVDGTRAVRSHQETDDQRDEFDALCKDARRIDMPRRVSQQQLVALQCKAKILAIFGGVRGGKSSFLADEIVDGLLDLGGPGVQIWWAAPTLEKTEIALRKLVLGETVGKGITKREVAPLLPPDLVSYVPATAKADRKYIECTEATRLHLKFLSRDGSNLKGDPPVLVGGDEFCAVKERENYRQILDRLMEADGRLIIATTPVAGHWLKEEVYDPGVHVSEWAGQQHAWAHLTAFDNPWVDEAAIRSTIAAINDPQRVRREIYGEWVGDGPLLWAHFDESKHIVEYDGPVSKWGDLVDVTPKALEQWALGAKVQRFGGMDFDINPMSFAAVTIACPRGLDITKSTNWIFVQTDEIVERCPTIHKFADRLEECGYNGTHIACDPSGAQYTPYRISHGVDVSSTHAKELTRRGFPTKACHISDSGNPKQPPVLDSCNVVHKLMRETVVAKDGTVWPRFLIHRKCKRTIDSLRTQEADENGKPIKEPGTESDRLSGPTDAMRYPAWAVFKREYSSAPKISY